MRWTSQDSRVWALRHSRAAHAVVAAKGSRLVARRLGRLLSKSSFCLLKIRLLLLLLQLLLLLSHYLLPLQLELLLLELLLLLPCIPLFLCTSPGRIL